MLLRQAKQCYVTAKGRTWAKNPSPVANRHPVVWIFKRQKKSTQYWQYQQMIEGLNRDLKKHSLVVMDSCRPQDDGCGK